MLCYIIYILVPVWINVQVVSSLPVEKVKKEREQGFGGTFELDGFRNGAPFYSDVKKRHFIYYTWCKSWHMTFSHHFIEDNCREDNTCKYVFKIDTQG